VPAGGEWLTEMIMNRSKNLSWLPSLVLATVVAVQPTMAQTPGGMPDYDVEKICKKQGAMMGGGSFLLQACLEQEQSAYDQLKTQWPTLDTKVIQQCRQMATMMGSSYFMLNACVEQELASAEKVAKFKFKK
jgi:hypothetical protein